MNKLRYRLVFNKTRGALMAVAETAASHSHGQGETRAGRASPSLAVTLKPIVFGLWGLMGLVFSSVVDAQIVADPSAPATQRPTILAAPNGVPVVNIQTPSSGGVSRNTYSQFDVASPGAILNNSRTDISTQQGGWVQGNPWLAGGTARIILNEVNSSNPSYLRGFVEVAGDRAQVVIANPAGVTCDGCGFVNASRATLTTGTPILNGGSLDGYAVRGGQVVVQGNGMDASQTDYTDLIGRAVLINAGLWAKNLNVVAGANQVSVDTTQVNKITGTGSAPAFAVDVAQLGGMYAGKITLIGTETGVGVRNAGTIGATVGDAVVTVDGQLINRHQISANGNLSITASQGIDNSQSLIAANQAVTLQASAINNAEGTIASTSSNASLTATTGNIDNHAGQIKAANSVSTQSVGLINSTGTIAGSSLGVNTQGQALDNAGGILFTSGTQDAGSLTIQSGALNNDAGLIEARGALAINTQGGTLTNTHSGTEFGILGHSTTTLTTGTFNNQGGFLGSANTLSLTASAVQNGSGQIGGNGDLQLNTASLDNQHGSIVAYNNATVTVTSSIDNSQGTISAGSTLTLQDGNAGSKALAITNTAGTLIAGNQLTIDSARLTGDGKLLSTGNLDVTLTQDYTHTGSLAADGTATLTTDGALVNQSSMKAGAGLNLRAATIDNQATGSLASTSTTLSTSSSGSITNRGYIDGQETVLTTGTLDNLGTGLIYGDHVAIAANTLNNDVENGTAATIAARTRLDLGVTTLNNQEQSLLFSAGDLAIGGGLDTTKRATGTAGTLNNVSATIEALGNVDIAADQINNSNAHFSTATHLVSTENITEYQGAGSANRYAAGTPNVYTYVDESVHLHTPDGNYDTWYLYSYTRSISETQVTSSEPGKILAGGNISLTANNLLNDNSHIVAGGTLTGTLGGLTNTEVFGNRTTTDSGTVTNYWRDHQKGQDTTGSSAAGYHPASTIQTITLTPTRYDEHSTPNGSGKQVGTLSVSPVTETPAGSSVVRTGGVTVTLPSSSLYHVTTNPTATYLIESDPRFTDYRTWLSSDYLLRALSLDPTTLQKRLGDGFYEQKLIREQIAQLTGRRFLDGYADDESQYAALMTNGATFAKAYHLIPGVALTGEQMAALTTDIVWLVEKSVTLPNGSTQKVLVPQVYARVQNTDLAPSGALIAGNSVNLNVSGDLVNRGSVVGKDLVVLNSDNLQNLGGRISGDNVVVSARTDINNIGGTLAATNNLIAQAGRDVNVQSTTRTQTSAQGSRTNVDQVATLSAGGGELVVQSGRDANFAAAAVLNQAATNNDGTPVAGTPGATTIVAGNNLNLGTVTTRSTQNNVWNANNFRKESSSQEVGTTIATSGDLNLVAGKDINATALAAASSGAVTVAAGNNLNLQAGTNSVSIDESQQHTSKNIFSSKTASSRDKIERNTLTSSALSGDTVTLAAGQDINVTASQVKAVGDLNVSAGRDVNVLAGESSGSESHDFRQSKSGYGGNLNEGLSYGVSSSEQKERQKTTTITTSSLTGDNVNVTAGRDVTVQAATVVADKNIAVTAGRDLAITTATQTSDVQTSSQSSSTSVNVLGGLGPRVTIYGNTDRNSDGKQGQQTEITSLLSANQGSVSLVAGANPATGADAGNVTIRGGDLIAKEAVAISGNRVDLQAASENSSSAFQSETSSLTIGATLTGTVGSRITQAYDAAQTAKNTDNDRLAAAATLKAGYDTWKLMGDLSKDGSANPASSGAAFGVQVAIGSSSTKSSSEMTQRVQQGTNIQAKDIAITAREGDLTATGAKLQGENIDLTAKKDIVLRAATSSQTQKSQQTGSNASVGVTFGGGEQNGFSIQIGVGQQRGTMNGEEIHFDNTLVTASNQLRFNSGGDTTLAGAQLAGQSVIGTVGGNLNIFSLQDTSQFNSSQSSSGFSISLCIPPICYGNMVTGSLQISKTTIAHNYRSAQGQSGINAGKDGFDITVANNTDLKGGAITSSADADKNRLTTGSLTYSDLTNEQNTKVKSMSVSAGYGGGSALSTLATNAMANGLGNLAGPGGLPKNGSESSQTLAVISPATVTITGGDAKSQAAADTLTHRDASTANKALKNTLTLQDAAKIQDDMKKAAEDAQAGQMVGSVAFNIAGDIAAKNNWAEGSPQKVVLHGIAGLIQGAAGGGNGLQSAVAAMANEALTDKIQAYINEQVPLPKLSDNPTQEELDAYRSASRQRTEFSEFAAQLIGGTTVALMGGTGREIQQGANVALTADRFNRQLHPDMVKAAKAKSQELAGKDGLSAEQWEQRLTQQLLYQNDSSYKSSGNDPVAESILKQLASATGIDMDARGNTAVYNNHAMNSQYLGQLSDSYRLAGNPRNMAIDPLVRAMSQAANDPNMVKQTPEQRKQLFDDMLIVAGQLPRESLTSSQTTDSSQSALFTALNRVGNSLLGTGILTKQEEEAVRQRQLQALVIGYGAATGAAGLTKLTSGSKVAKTSARTTEVAEETTQASKAGTSYENSLSRIATDGEGVTNAGTGSSLRVNKNGASTAIDDLKNLPQFSGKTKTEIEATLISQGYTSAPANSGGTVWTKSLPDGNTAAVRIDPAVERPTPRGWADEVPHVHKEIVPTTEVKDGNYKPSKAVTTLDDNCCSTTNRADTHIPIN